jgi:hypothetical protein
LDPEISLQRTIRNSSGSTSSPAGVGELAYDWDSAIRATAVVLSVGMSGWFGGH